MSYLPLSIPEIRIQNPSAQEHAMANHYLQSKIYIKNILKDILAVWSNKF